jgi:hypothetical protein
MTRKTLLAAAFAALSASAPLAASSPASAGEPLYPNQPGFCQLYGCTPRYNGGLVTPRQETVRKYQQAIGRGGIQGGDNLLNRQVGSVIGGLHKYCRLCGF